MQVPGDRNIMREPSVADRPIIQSGAKLVLLAALIALAGCANDNNSYSSASSASVPIASADSSSSTVNKVSDALGQRLDGMLNSQHAAGH
jgi:uncharacterized lipoprotein YajG